MKPRDRRRTIWTATAWAGALLALIALLACSVIRTIAETVEGPIRASQPQRNETKLNDLRIEVWLSQAAYEHGREPVIIGLIVENGGDQPQALARSHGPFATIRLDQPNLPALLLQTISEEPGSGNRIEVQPGERFEMQWALGTLDDRGVYNVYVSVWVEGFSDGQMEVGETFIIR